MVIVATTVPSGPVTSGGPSPTRTRGTPGIAGTVAMVSRTGATVKAAVLLVDDRYADVPANLADTL